jgi:hypothetical protein
MTVRPILAIVAAAALAACAPRTPAAGTTPAPSADVGAAPAPAADTTTGGRWYGYEGGLDDAESAARTIEGATQYWRAVEAPWSAGADTGSIVAHFQNRRLRRVAVTWAGGGVTGSGAYTYDEQARLFHYRGEERRTTGTGRGRRTQRVALSVAVNPRGELSARRKTVAGRTQALTPDEVAAIVAREAAVRAAAVAALGR